MYCEVVLRLGGAGCGWRALGSQCRVVDHGRESLRAGRYFIRGVAVVVVSFPSRLRCMDGHGEGGGFGPAQGRGATRAFSTTFRDCLLGVISRACTRPLFLLILER